MSAVVSDKKGYDTLNALETVMAGRVRERVENLVKFYGAHDHNPVTPDQVFQAFRGLDMLAATHYQAIRQAYDEHN